MRVGELGAALWAFSMIVVGLWIRQGGVRDLTAGWTAAWTSITQITGLLASALGLVGLVLVARLRCIERRVGLDRIFVWHRWLGASMAILVGAHVGASLVAWSDGLGWWQALLDLTGREPYMAAATVGALLVGVVTVTSLRSIRRSLSYETWYFVHLTAYVGLALAFAHEVVLGGDFADDRPRPVVLGAGPRRRAVVALLWGRWGRLPARPWPAPCGWRGGQPVAARHRRDHPRRAAASATSRPTPASSPCCARWCRRLWWQAHPYSPLGRAHHRRACASPSRTAATPRGPSPSCRSAPASPSRGPTAPAPPTSSPPATAWCWWSAGWAWPRPGPCSSASPAPAPATPRRALPGPQHRRTSSTSTSCGPSPRPGAAGCSPWWGRRPLAVRDPFGAASLRAAVPDLAERVAVVCGPESPRRRRPLRPAGRRPPVLPHPLRTSLVVTR